ncbi:MAG TPA: hypothetical protein VGK48_13735 [Terriglobia bacterium]
MESESETRAQVSADGACDEIEKQAAVFIESADGIEQRLLSKSLQEALFHCAGFNTELSSAELRRKFRHTLRREGSASIVQQFLAFYLFNFVWFHTGESFRSQAWTSAEFESDLQNAEKYCQRIVADSWNSGEVQAEALDLVTARRIIQKIEERLCGAG